MSDLTARAIADLKAELDQQRTRAEAAEQELRAVSDAFDRHMKEGRSVPEVRVAEAAAMTALFSSVSAVDKLAAVRAHLVGLDLATLDKDEPTSTHAVTNWWEMRKLIAAAREALAP